MITDVTLLASSGDDGVGGFAMVLFAVGPAAGIGIWVWIYGKYRNRNARYMPERVVHHQVLNLTENDAKIKHFQTSASSVQGRNDGSPHVRAAVTRTMSVEGPPPAPEE